MNKLTLLANEDLATLKEDIATWLKEWPTRPVIQTKGQYRFASYADTQMLAKEEANTYLSHAMPCLSGKRTWLFTGQGSQQANMCHHLYQNIPSFKKTLDEIGTYMDAYLSISLQELLFNKAHVDALNQTGYTQPALFAIEYALAALWSSYGIQADLVMGHSVGEFAAATFAGFMSLEDGVKLICHRARLMQALPSGGSMAAIACNQKELQAHLGSFKEACLDVAAYNSPKQTVVSGDIESIEALCAHLQSEKIRATPLTVSHGFHSCLMNPMLDEFRDIAETITYTNPTIPLISNVTSKVIDTPLDANYWVEHISAPVDFLGSMNTAKSMETSIFLEIGPHPILTNLGKRCITDKALTWAYSCRKGEALTPPELLATLHMAGYTMTVPLLETN